MRALLSAYDRTGLAEFARTLADLGFELISTGGTQKHLEEAGLEVTTVSAITRSPEILDGRVKTLHPAIHGGILARRDLPSHMDELADQGITGIDVVVNNLYPFIETISKAGVTLVDALENIDIGGPAMTRAAAKNFPSVVIVVDPADYGRIGELLRSGDVPLEERRRLAARAFQHVALYDTAVSTFLRSPAAAREEDDALFPAEWTAGWDRVARPRYGENPHQKAAIYARPGECGGIVNAKQLHGIELSYLNYFDGDAALTAANSFPVNAVSIVKHANPCGLAVHVDQAEAYRRALAGDPVSAFGGIVGFNSVVTAETAEAMKGVLFDVIVAPGYEAGALELLRKRRRTRVLEVAPAEPSRFELRTVSGGVLAQQPDRLDEDPASWKVVTKRAPTSQELADLAFAWKVCRLVHSNAIVFAKDRALLGMGAGQPNRVTSVMLAGRVAGDSAKGCAMASDAYFPFHDGVEQAASASVAAVVQPGGSIRDGEVIEAADKLGLAMVFTGTRHFLH
jgi:phosphoribosylaminoimidazolecarboxamide formyltransferase/IMP cyclohydrolase